MMEALAGGKPLSARARRIARSREELLGLLADFPEGGDSDRELSFSDLVEGAEPDTNHVSTPPRTAREDHGSSLSSEPQRHQEAEAPKQQEAAAAAREKRLRRRRSDGRGSCGGDGVLLNFYVPGGLLTRSMTAPRHGRGTLPAGAGQGATASAVAAGKASLEAPLTVGCWPALWGRAGRDRRSKPAKPAAGRRDGRMPV